MPRSTSSGSKWQAKLEPLREKLNAALKKSWQEWEIPREADASVVRTRRNRLHADWWTGPHRPPEGDRCVDRCQGGVRVPLRQAVRGQEEGPRCGPLHRREPQSPHRVLGVDENDELIDPKRQAAGADETQSFAQMVLENLKIRWRPAGAQGRQDRIHCHWCRGPGIWSAPKESVPGGQCRDRGRRSGRRSSLALSSGP
jgi:hypothetical protein